MFRLDIKIVLSDLFTFHISELSIYAEINTYLAKKFTGLASFVSIKALNNYETSLGKLNIIDMLRYYLHLIMHVNTVFHEFAGTFSL